MEINVCKKSTLLGDAVKTLKHRIPTHHKNRCIKFLLKTGQKSTGIPKEICVICVEILEGCWNKKFILYANNKMRYQIIAKIAKISMQQKHHRFL
jgi:hypothetical protein